VSIPLEMLSWNIDRRRRYVETIKQGKKKMHRARGMLVGCTGAGKTTVLKKLQKEHETHENTMTTFGLEIHENVFEITSDNTLKSMLHFQ
jgi:adenylate kinase